MDFFYSGRDLYSRGNHTITDTHIDVIKKLKYRMDIGGYYSPRPVWSILENEEILNEHGVTMNEIWKSVHFITMLGRSSNMPVVFENLLRQMYLDEDDEGFRTGYKRPFGNSGVLQDVRDELIKSGFYGKLTCEEEEELNYEEEQKTLDAYMKWLTSDFLVNFEMNFRSFEFIDNSLDNLFVDDLYWEKLGEPKTHHILNYWRINKSEIRDNKLKDLGI